MEVYGRQHASKFPATPPRQRQHQRYANGDCKGPPPEVSMSRAHFGTTRYSLPTPGSRGSPQSLPPWHGRRQAVPTSATPPHYATPTRVRQVPTSSPQALGTVQANTEQWESLRSRGLVLRGSGEAPRPSVAFAPQLSEIPVSVVI